MRNLEKIGQWSRWARFVTCSASIFHFTISFQITGASERLNKMAKFTRSKAQNLQRHEVTQTYMEIKMYIDFVAHRAAREKASVPTRTYLSHIRRSIIDFIQEDKRVIAEEEAAARERVGEESAAREAARTAEVPCDDDVDWDQDAEIDEEIERLDGYIDVCAQVLQDVVRDKALARDTDFDNHSDDDSVY